MANSQLTNILLLLAVGAIIYYISQPEPTKATKEVEGLEDMEPEPETEVVDLETADMLELPESTTMVEETAPVVAQPEPEVSVPVMEGELSGMSGDAMGASLDGAFMGAVPPSTVVDQVDFNRNNVTEFDSSQYLPKDVNNEWFDTDFTKAKYNLNDDKMINTDRYMIGVNTVGQSLKNPAYDIRGTIPNPKYTVSPWNNSTYEPDTNIKPLC
jgi:hypothetical protein